MRHIVVIPVIALLGACGGPPPPEASMSLSSLLADTDVTGYERAVAVRPLRFPLDHSGHPRFKTEWWYFTGNLDSDTEERFGFQLTFFRFALTPDVVARRGWESQAVWMGHLAVTDIARDRFFSAERFSRDGLGLAGNNAAPFSLWIEDWAAIGRDDDPFPLALEASDQEFGLALELEDEKGPVAQGEEGLDRKGPEPGNASYYYSMPRLRAAGDIRVGEVVHRVTGSAWMDREWSSNALDPTLAGWDWIALQLSDGTDLMLYRLRTEQGRVSPFSSGAFISRDGTTMPLTSEEFEMRPTASWTSPVTGSRYPTQWSISIPSLALELDIAAAVEEQEMNLAVRYWEGAVTAAGHARGIAIAGRGYLELTGY